MIQECVKRFSEEQNELIWIPKIWDTLNYETHFHCPSHDGEIMVDRIQYYTYYINYIMDHSNLKEESPNIQCSNMYSAQLRMLTAWKHDGNKVDGGTLLKTILLLPYLKKLNVDILYILPFFKVGGKYKKGMLGSGYSIKNIFCIDETLYDNLMGDYTKDKLDMQLKALVQACHNMGMKVMIDVVFRTAARDSDLIKDHPDWFYWIDFNKCMEFRPMDVETLPKLTNISEDNISCIYKSKNLKEYLLNFSENPKAIDSERWQKIVEVSESTGESLLSLIEQEFQITTAPAFSDVINDFQDIWTDATYLRLYFDNNKIADQYILARQAPYITQDIAKASILHGNQKNSILWEYLEQVLIYYIETFQVDGARIDMGHALPKKLIESIIQKCRLKKKDFILWSENFDICAGEKSREQGFNMLTGGIFKEFRKYNLVENNSLIEYVNRSPIPIISSLETPDTLRMRKFQVEYELKMVTAALLPNSVFFINNGAEIGEKQPMNIGLEENVDLYSFLKMSDELNGRLSFFDEYVLHWKECKEELDLFQKITLLRRNMWKSFEDTECKFENFSDKERKVLIWRYSNSKEFFYLVVKQSSNDNDYINEWIHACARDEKTIIYELCKDRDIYNWKKKKDFLLEESKIYIALSNKLNRNMNL